jgi:hypothetical protein
MLDEKTVRVGSDELVGWAAALASERLWRNSPVTAASRRFQTVSSSDSSRSASPDCRIQWHRYKASPPEARRTSVSWTRGTQRSSSMLGSAVSSSTPKDFQPSSHIGQLGSCPLMNCHAFSPGPTQGCPYIAVGMQRAVDSAIGLPSRSTSASWMLAFLMPAAYEQQFFTAFPDLAPEDEGIAFGDDVIAVWGTLRRTSRGEWLGIPPGGGMFAVPFANVVPFSQGLMGRRADLLRSRHAL